MVSRTWSSTNIFSPWWAHSSPGFSLRGYAPLEAPEGLTPSGGVVGSYHYPLDATRCSASPSPARAGGVIGDASWMPPWAPKPLPPPCQHQAGFNGAWGPRPRGVASPWGDPPGVLPRPEASRVIPPGVSNLLLSSLRLSPPGSLPVRLRVYSWSTGVNKPTLNGPRT